MRVCAITIGWIALISIVTPCAGETISFINLRHDSAKYAAEGVHITPTGPDNLPIYTGQLEVLGVTDAFLQNSVASRYYSGQATFDNPVSEITFDVARANNSELYNRFTLVASDNGRRVGRQSVNLAPVGDWSHVVLRASAIDHIEWHGDGYVFRPYYVRDMSVKFLPAVGSPGGVQVGAGVPEPGSLGLSAILSIPTLLRRRRSIR